MRLRGIRKKETEEIFLLVLPCQIQQGATVVEIGLAAFIAGVPILFSTEMGQNMVTII